MTLSVSYGPNHGLELIPTAIVCINVEIELGACFTISLNFNETKKSQAAIQTAISGVKSKVFLRKFFFFFLNLYFFVYFNCLKLNL